MLETIREYAGERLEGSGEREDLSGRHLQFFAAMAQEVEPELKHADQLLHLHRLEADHDNLRAALEHGLDDVGDEELAARLATALLEFWDIRCHFADSRRWFEAVLERRDRLSPVVVAKALHGAGLTAHRQGDHDEAIALYREAVEANETSGDLAGLARALSSLAYAHLWREEVAEGVQCAERSVSAAEECGDAWVTACAFASLGGARAEEGDNVEAEALYEESRRLFAVAGDRRNEAIEKLNLACLAIVAGAYERADRLLTDAAASARSFGDTGQASYAVMHIAEVALRTGRYSDASRELRDAILLGGDSLNLLPRCFIGVALLADNAGDAVGAMRMLAAVEALLDEPGLESSADDFWKPTLRALRRRLESESLQRSIEEWSRRPLQDAVDEAMAVLDRMDRAKLQLSDA